MATKIIDRYLTNEVLKAFTAITGILLLIVLSNRFIWYLTKATTGELPIEVVLKIVELYIPELLSYLIPLGFFMAILFAYGRLYTCSEMTVLAACGISTWHIVQLTLRMAFILSVLTAILTLWLIPRVTEIREQVLAEGESFGVMHSLLPGRFQTFSEGRLVFYIESAPAKQKHLTGIFIAERPDNPSQTSKDERGWTVITAEQADVKHDLKTGNFYLRLTHGQRYQGLPGSANYTVVSFQEYGREILKQTEFKPNDTLRLKNSAALFNSSNREDAAELQWRLSLPLTVLILGLIAVPLAEVKPRQGRFVQFLPAIVLYIIYYNLFTVCRRWVATGTLPSLVGVWWVHGLFLFVGLILIAKQIGWIRRKA